jgi:hypothetical protein
MRICYISSRGQPTKGGPLTWELGERLESGENYIIKSLMICTPHSKLFG